MELSTCILGLGIIGEIWARHFAADRIPFCCWNRTPKNTPGFVPDIGEVVSRSDVILIVVSDPKAVNQVIERIEPELKPGKIVIQSSTISARWTKEFAARVRKKGASFLEAPFTGSKPAAEARKTIFFIGGETMVFEKVRPLLSRISQVQLYAGGIGLASTLKLALNLNLALVMQAFSESLSLARKEGVPDEVYFKALDLNMSKSALVDMKKPKILGKDFSPQFSLKHMYKDLKLALETADQTVLPLGKSLKRIYDSGMKKGFAEDDFSGLIRLLES